MSGPARWEINSCLWLYVTEQCPVHRHTNIDICTNAIAHNYTITCSIWGTGGGFQFSFDVNHLDQLHREIRGCVQIRSPAGSQCFTQGHLSRVDPDLCCIVLTASAPCCTQWEKWKFPGLQVSNSSFCCWLFIFILNFKLYCTSSSLMTSFLPLLTSLDINNITAPSFGWV